MTPWRAQWKYAWVTMLIFISHSEGSGPAIDLGRAKLRSPTITAVLENSPIQFGFSSVSLIARQGSGAGKLATELGRPR